MTRSILVRPRDPMMFRDGRPFDAGQGARTVGWPMPSTVAGYLRTKLHGNGDFDEAAQHRLRAVKHLGPFLAYQMGDQDWHLAFPSPADAAIYSAGKANLEIVPLRPRQESIPHSGCDLPLVCGRKLIPLAGLEPSRPSAHAPHFWTATNTLAWLEQTTAQNWYKTAAELGFDGLPEQPRLHTQIEADRRNAREHMLFRTTGLEFDYDGAFHSNPPNPLRRRRSRDIQPPMARAIFARLESGDGNWADTDGLSPFSGEQRLAVWSSISDLLPAPPPEIPGNLIRVQLITPGRFGGGWKPDWAETGDVPDCDGLRMRLVSAVVKRFVPISGFDMTKAGQDRIRATRFLAPAGSVYFFEVLSGSPRQLWLRSISDNEQDRRDGFGIVLTGGWQWR